MNHMTNLDIERCRQLLTSLLPGKCDWILFYSGPSESGSISSPGLSDVDYEIMMKRLQWAEREGRPKIYE